LPFVDHFGRVADPFSGEPLNMGKLDRRHSMKMKRREAQAKKKLRHMRPLQKAALAAAAAAPAKKARAPKAAAASAE
jgi:hypothetical protein